MGLSQWPKKFTRPDPVESGSRSDFVQAFFEAEEVYVKARTAKAVGLSESDAPDAEIFMWIPVSQIEGDGPEAGEWIEYITISRWLADEKGLDY